MKPLFSHAEERDRLFREDLNSDELIKPFLRGRDVKRWVVQPHDLYLLTFPYGFHKELQRYPAVLKHLTQFEAALKERGQCKSSRGKKEGGQHHWLELDNNPKPDFLAAFGKPKILIPAISPRPSAAADRQGYYCNNKASIALHSDPEYLAAIVNSRCSYWFATQVFATKQNRNFDCEPRYSRQLPIPHASGNQRAALAQLVRRVSVAAASGKSAMVDELEREIDALVYSLFSLSNEEITYLESSLARTSPLPANAD
jgi:adenine-specific DNA-methyltransferase